MKDYNGEGQKKEKIKRCSLLGSRLLPFFLSFCLFVFLSFCLFVFLLSSVDTVTLRSLRVDAFDLVF